VRQANHFYHECSVSDETILILGAEVVWPKWRRLSPNGEVDDITFDYPSIIRSFDGQSDTSETQSSTVALLQSNSETLVTQSSPMAGG